MENNQTTQTEDSALLTIVMFLCWFTFVGLFCWVALESENWFLIFNAGWMAITTIFAFIYSVGSAILNVK